jgi:hypothetical protein
VVGRKRAPVAVEVVNREKEMMVAWESMAVSESASSSGMVSRFLLSGRRRAKNQTAQAAAATTRDPIATPATIPTENSDAKAPDGRKEWDTEKELETMAMAEEKPRP